MVAPAIAQKTKRQDGLFLTIRLWIHLNHCSSLLFSLTVYRMALIFSADAFEEDVKECLQAGMDAHLSKPVDIELLKKTLGETVLKPNL